MYSVILMKKVVKCNDWAEIKSLLCRNQSHFHPCKTQKNYKTKSKKNLVCKIMKITVFLTPYETVCLHRAVVAFCIARIIGEEVKIVSGYIPHPFTLHVWVEDKNGNEYYNSPYTTAKKIEFDIFE